MDSRSSEQELCQCWFSLDFRRAGGQKPWSVASIIEMCKTYWQMARRLVNDGSIHQLMGFFFPFEAEVKFFPNHQTTKVECISSAQKSFPEISFGWAFQAGGSWAGDLLMRDMEDLKTMESRQQPLLRRSVKR